MKMENQIPSPRESGNTYITILPVQYSEKSLPQNFPRYSKHYLSSSFSNPVLTFLNLAHAICFSPFKIKQGPNRKFYIGQWLPQQIICFVGMLSSIYYRVQEVLVELPQSNHPWNPVLYFILFHRLSNLVFHLTVWITLWLMKDRFFDIVEYSYRKMTSKSIKNLNNRLSKLVAFIGITNTALVFFYFVNGTDIFPYSQFDPVRVIKCFAAHARTFSFCIERKLIDCAYTGDFPLDQMSTLDIFVTVMVIISRFLRRINGISEELLVLVGPLTIWAGVKDFVSTVVNEDSNENKIDAHTWNQISNKYKQLLEYTDLVNRTFGPTILAYTLTALLYFSIKLDEFLTAEHDLVQKFKFCIYYILIISTFTISAEISRQIGKMTPWISRNLQDSLSEMSQRELTVILHEISSNRVGMSACGLFTLTYSVVAQMTGVIVTYFIITVQYREQK